MANDIAPSLRSELAPTGKLRVGINYGNFLLVTSYSEGAEPRGPAPDLARELGRRVDAPVEFVAFDTAGKLADAVKTGAWDVAFLGAEPQRAGEIAFTAAYLEIPATYLVPAGSPIRTMGDVDREGVRIAVADKSAYELYLSRNIKRRDADADPGHRGLPQALSRREAGGAVRAQAPAAHGRREDPGRPPAGGAIHGRPAGDRHAEGARGRAKFLRRFVEDVKGSGFVAGTLARNGVKGVSVAPPTPVT